MFHYPAVRRDEDFVEILHNHSIKDPYRHLEDPDAEETKKFVEAQQNLFQNFIKDCDIHAKLKKKLTDGYDYERYGVPFKKGNNYYYFHNSGLQPQSVMYTQKSVKDEATVFFDPNKLSEDGTISIGTYSFSKSGKIFGYSLSQSGSDWVNIHVREVGAEKDLEETPIQWAKFTSITFTHDEKGFFYGRFPEPSVSQDKAGTEVDQSKTNMIYYHRIGTKQENDILVYKDEADTNAFYAHQISDCGTYLILTISQGTEPKNLVFIADLVKQFGSKSCFDVPVFTEIVGEYNAQYSYITNEGTTFYFETTLNAQKKRVVRCDIAPRLVSTKTTSKKTMTITRDGKSITTRSETVTTSIKSEVNIEFVEIIPESDPLDFINLVDKDKLVTVYMKDVKHVIKVYNLVTGVFLNDIEIPNGSVIGGMSGEKDDTEMFFKYASFTSPGVIHRYDFQKNSNSVFRETVVKGFDSSIFDVKQVFYRSEDRTKIPMYIVHRKNAILNGENPTVLYGYGGFNISILPFFSMNFLTFVEKMGGVLAVANIRGGGEYGQEWHDQGRLFNKQNCFTDFQYAAKYLISEKYTCAAKLAINGGSNGGLLVGACLNQAPELFGLGIAEVGVLDLLRFHKFTIGKAWTADYGSPDTKEDFENQIKISPLHNVPKNGIYPAVLIMTGDHDDRVVPLHSMKFAATLQHDLKNSPNPIMMRVNVKAGHGAGKSMQQMIEEAADKFTYIALVLGAKYDD